MSRSQVPQETAKEATSKRFIHCLDQLVGQSDKNVYGKVSQDRIEETIENFPVADDQGNNFSIFSSIQKFKKFSPGVYLMFRLLKHLLLMFAIISIIAIVQVIVLFKSPFYQGYESVVRINMLRLTIASLQVEDFEFYVVLDAIIVVVICVFYIWWNQNIRNLAQSCNQENWLPSYLTVQLQNVDKSFTESSLRSYLSSQEINPQEIYTGRNYGKFLSHYKRLTQNAIQFKIMKQLFFIQEDEETRKKQANKIIQKFLKLKKIYCSIKQDKFNQRKYKPKQVFIVLKNYTDRQKLLSKQGNLLTCSKRSTSQQEFVFKPCQVQPQAIAWENIGISFINYIIRAVFVFFILSVVTCFGVFIIFMLQILETASIGDAYHYHEQAIDYQITSASTQQGMGCKECHQPINSGKLTILILLTPFVIFLCKKLIMGLLSHFVKFRKYPSQVSRIKSQMITLAVFYFTVICSLHLFLYLKTDTPGSKAISIYELLHPIIVKMFNITNYNPASIHLYSDYSLDWYKQATFFIIIICSTSFNIANGFKYLVNYITFQLQKRKARKQRTMYEVKNCLKGVDLHIQNVYASMIVINYFALLYGCPMPITVCFCLVNLVFLFYLTKLTLIKVCHKPMRMGHSINRTASNMLFLGIILHCIMSPIFLYAKGIAKNNAHYKYNIEHPQQSVSKESVMSVQQRFQKLGPFYLTVATFITLYVLLRKPFLTYVLPRIKQRFLKKNKDQCQESERQQKKTEHFGLYPTYSMHNSPCYGEVLKNVFLLNRIEAKRITCPIPKTLKQLQNSVCEQKLGVFNKVLQINRKYLDKQKYQKLYDEVQQLARIQQSSQIKISSIMNYNSERATNDNIIMDGQLTDRVKQQD